MVAEAETKMEVIDSGSEPSSESGVEVCSMRLVFRELCNGQRSKEQLEY